MLPPPLSTPHEVCGILHAVLNSLHGGLLTASLLQEDEKEVADCMHVAKGPP